MPKASGSTGLPQPNAGNSSALGQSVPPVSQTPMSKKAKKKAKLVEKLDTMEALDKLVHQRGVAKGKLTRIFNTIINEDEVVQLTEAQTKVYLKKLEMAHKDYNDVHDKIMSVVTADDRDHHDELYEEFDVLHDQISILLEEQMCRINATAAATAAIRTNAVQNPQAPVVIQQPLRMPIPTFDGRYENWPKFKAMFKDLVDKGPDPPAIKLYHLDKSLVGSAAGIIDVKTINEGNYAHAWKILEDRYENKRHAVDTHIHALLNLKGMTKESHVELQGLVDECTKHVESLKFLEQQFTGVSELFVVHLLAAALDKETRRRWESTIGHGELPSYEKMLKFLKEQSFILERCEVTSQKQVPVQAKPTTSSSKPTVQKAHAAVSSGGEQRCDFCGKGHQNFTCGEFKSLSVPQRLVKVRERNVCFNCLRKGHRSIDCASDRSCQKCKRRHHSLLHAEEKPKQVEDREEMVSKSEQAPMLKTSEKEERPAAPVQTTATCSSVASIAQQVLLLTAVVDVYDENCYPHPCRVLLDSASQVNLISRSMVNLLGLRELPSNVTVVGVNNTKTQSSRSSKVHVSSRYTEFQARVRCLITDQVTADLPTSSINVSSWKLPSGLQLADPQFFQTNKVDMLLGNEWFLKLLLPGEILLADHLPVLRETRLGWVVGGVFDDGPGSEGTVYSHIVTLDELSQSIQRFWEVEDIGGAETSSTAEEECEEHFRATHRRDPSGRYIVELPLKDTVKDLGDSRSLALKRFYTLERKLVQNPELRKQYQDFMEEYEVLGHCKEVNENKDPAGIKKWYLPHHAVLRPSNTTTKCRVVFDASARSSGCSLNDVMKIGAIPQSDLQSICLRFRVPRYVLAADVAKMYRQILVDRSHTPLCRVFWRKDPSQPLRVLELTTVTYGTASAPFLATRALQQLAIDEGDKYPEAADIVKNDFYIDNALFGFDNYWQAEEAQSQLVELLKAGGFHLHKWASNHPELLKKVPEEDRDELVSIDQCSVKEVIKTLGLLWNPTEDSLQFVSSLNSEVNPTKRQVLSLIARMFDPLGLVAPVIVIGKLLMKSIWKEELDWDEELTGDLRKKCAEFLKALSGVTNLKIPRQVVSSGAVFYELHGFGDATPEAYGACVYLRSVVPGQAAVVKLMCAKSKIVPKNVLTIPRKELLAALLLHRLVKKVIAAVKMSFSEIVLWSDNQVVLAWLEKNPNRLETFVRNRVSEINSTQDQFKWKYVNTLDNPADIVSRGQSAEDLANNDLWWNGPLFLRSEVYQSVVPEPLADEDVPEMRHTAVASAVVLLKELPVFRKYESFRKLQRVLAYVLRFCQNAKVKVKERRLIGHLTAAEMRYSMKVIVRVVQTNHFAKEIESIKSGEYCKRFSKLSPFLDDGLIRVGGRLRHSSLPYEAKHQWVLPSHHPVVDSLISTLHREYLHIGPSALLAHLRRQFWVLGARSAVRKVTQNCVQCFKVSSKLAKQFMGDLPVVRCERAPSFLKVGVDFAGPILIKQKSRKAAPVKGYICLFVCLVTKGIHLEAVEDLSTEAFIAALLRFVSRRGFPEDIFSDNGTNFIGARNELNELYRLFKLEATEQQIEDFCQSRQIQWRTIPPHAPHMGGLWEAGVKSAKMVMKKVCHSSLLTMTEFSTLLCQIEAVLNSRPLYASSEDPSEPEPLTPGHFMIDRPLTAIPEPSLEKIPANHLSRWQYVQRLRGDFWKRWTKHYLMELQTRSKWTKKEANIRPGMIVLVMDERLPPQQWKIGKIDGIYPGSDGLVRVADVRLPGGVFKRPIHKLAPLPILDNAEPASAVPVGEDVRAVDSSK